MKFFLSEDKSLLLLSLYAGFLKADEHLSLSII